MFDSIGFFAFIATGQIKAGDCTFRTFGEIEDKEVAVLLWDLCSFPRYK